ncbi:MAG: hypothetical protein Q8K02_07060 [Flavobacterium sp.]|jgi:hypothetical protein|nr:hypothetical protein [Flavobacterium sp.]
MKNRKLLTLFSILCLQFSIAQEIVSDTINIKKEKKHERFYIESGIHIPLDNLSKVIQPSPQIGFWYRSEFQKDNFVELGFNVFIPIKKEAFVFNIPDTLIKSDPKGASGMVGFRFNKIYQPFYNKSISLEWNSSFGYAFFLYDANYHRYLNQLQSETETNKPYSRAFSTIHTGMGFKINYKNTGFQAHYQWTPYALFSDYIDENFGSQALQIGIFYRQ